MQKQISKVQQTSGNMQEWGRICKTSTSGSVECDASALQESGKLEEGRRCIWRLQETIWQSSQLISQ